MRLRDLKRFVRALLPRVYITSSRELAGIGNGALQGMAWLDIDGDPVILYATGLTERERDLTILHELAHHVLGDTRMRVLARGGRPFVREQWREDRADRWAAEMLGLLQCVDGEGA